MPVFSEGENFIRIIFFMKRNMILDKTSQNHECFEARLNERNNMPSVIIIEGTNHIE